MCDWHIRPWDSHPRFTEHVFVDCHCSMCPVGGVAAQILELVATNSWIIVGCRSINVPSLTMRRAHERPCWDQEVYQDLILTESVSIKVYVQGWDLSGLLLFPSCLPGLHCVMSEPAVHMTSVVLVKCTTFHLLYLLVPSLWSRLYMCKNHNSIISF